MRILLIRRTLLFSGRVFLLDPLQERGYAAFVCILFDHNPAFW